ncbi:transposase [Streptomyces sp. NPDC056773]|uniref:transposase n=1 Tax=unclassified Streptomyces TaxID=2593676 RepID=UPI0036BCD406
MACAGRIHRRPRPPARRRSPKRGLRDPALGRSRGGLTSEIHLACDGRGRPLAFVVTGGNTNDCIQFTAVMEAIRVPRKRLDQVCNRARRGGRGGRPPAFDRQVCKHRNVVERCFNRLKQWRGIATRYDKNAESYEAAITLASILVWAGHLTTTPPVVQVIPAGGSDAIRQPRPGTRGDPVCSMASLHTRRHPSGWSGGMRAGSRAVG